MSPSDRQLAHYVPDLAAFQRLLADELERGALFVPTLDPPPPSTRVTLRLQVGQHPQPLEFEAMVVHTQRVGEAGPLGPGAGMVVQGAARVILAARRLQAEIEAAAAAPPPPGEGSSRLGVSRIRPPAAGSSNPASSSPPTPSATVAPPAAAPPSAVPPPTSPPAEDPRQAERRQEQIVRRVTSYLESTRGGDHYRTLGVPRTATLEDIRIAFFTLARELHPDAHFRRVPPEVIDQLEHAYQRATEAYQVLMHPDRRIQYDLSIGVTTRAQGESETTSRRRFAVQVASRFREQRGEQVGRARTLVARAKEAHLAGDLLGARSALKLALTFDPFQEEGRRLLEAVEQDLLRRPDDPYLSASAAGSRGRPPQRGRSGAAVAPSRSSAAARPLMPSSAAATVAAVDPAGRGGSRVESLLRQARQAMADGKRGAARVWLQQLLAIEQSHPEARRLLERIDREESGSR